MSKPNDAPQENRGGENRENTAFYSDARIPRTQSGTQSEEKPLKTLESWTSDEGVALQDIRNRVGSFVSHDVSWHGE